MAQRRMFSKHIIDSDAFLDMPLSTQSLYFHLSMRGDDDGFINSPKKIMRMVGSTEDELKILLSKRFILDFESGVIVIKHWRMHNQIRNDRHNKTVYKEEFSRLQIKENGSYSEKTDSIEETTQKVDWQPNGNQMAPQFSIGEVSIGKVSIDKEPPKKSQSAKADKINPYQLANKAIKSNLIDKSYQPILLGVITNTTMDIQYHHLKGICEKITGISDNLRQLYAERYNDGARSYTLFALLHYMRYREWFITLNVFKYFDDWIKTWDKDTRSGYANNGEYYIYELGDMSSKEKIDTVSWTEWTSQMMIRNRSK